MGKGMQPLGFGLAATGAFLVDCGVQNRAPIGTIKAILGNPGAARQTLDTMPPAYPSGIPPITDQGTGGFPQGGGSGNAPAVVQRVMQYWRAQVGKPYRWGTAGPNTFDCSGLMYAGYKYAGVTIPRSTALLLASRLQRITNQSALKPGDIIFPYVGHCFGYLGGGMMVEAPHTGTTVHIAKVYKFWTARRVVNW